MRSQSRKQNMKKKSIALPPFDKYELYKDSVQSPEADVEFLKNAYQELTGTKPAILREDFCGTFALCCEWVKLAPEHLAIGLDIDQEPIDYGKANYLSQLEESAQERINIIERDVLSEDSLPSADIVCALNFSYFCFKDRSVLKKYFQKVADSLNPGGIFVLDCFGGGKCCEANEEETEFTDLKFSYFWDQDNYDPLSNYAKFYIHFKRQGEKKREKVFTYDWRMWSIPELRDILKEVGLAETHTYWEGNDENGEGNGVFSKTESGEECESWVAYIVGRKAP